MRVVLRIPLARPLPQIRLGRARGRRGVLSFKKESEESEFFLIIKKDV